MNLMYHIMGMVADKLLRKSTLTDGVHYCLIKPKRSRSKSLVSQFLGLFHVISVVFYCVLFLSVVIS